MYRSSPLTSMPCSLVNMPRPALSPAGTGGATTGSASSPSRTSTTRELHSQRRADLQAPGRFFGRRPRAAPHFKATDARSF